MSVRSYGVARRVVSGFTLVIFLVLVTGCAVGPDYTPPEIRTPKQWHSLPSGGPSARPEPQVLARWWTVLDDPALTRLIEQAVDRNLDLKKARAHVREARARRGVALGGLLPSLRATGSTKYTWSSPAGGTGLKPNTGDLEQNESYATGFDAAWEVDVFGGGRRTFEAARADYEASQEALQDVLVSLVAEVALNYVELRTYQKRLGLAEEGLKVQSQLAELVAWRNKAGLAGGLEVEKANYSLEATRARLPVLRANLKEVENRLAVLVGEFPGALSETLGKPDPIPTAPLEVAVGVPAETLRRRPDVRQAERKLAAQTARVGEATAEMYPKFSLTGTIGLEALTVAGLFGPGSLAYSLAAGLAWNIFNGGALRQNVEVQDALQEQALADYQAAVLGALEEVENALTALALEQERLKSLEQAAGSSHKAFDLAYHQYQAGYSGFQEVLETQQAWLNYQDQLAESQGTLTSNLIRLYKALGGGWESTRPLEG
ncbi:MAG: efflux transporter outer membrane subunit [Thermodesulfobacteriota bacterium]